MNPYQFLPIHPALKEIVSLIAVMHADFKALGLSSTYHFPWMNNTHLFFPLVDEPLLVKENTEKEYQSFNAAYFVGPQLMNKVAYFGSQRHVVGITFKPGAIQRLARIPANQLVNLDLDATLIFGNGIKEIESQLKHAFDNTTILKIIEGFLFGIFGKIEDATPFDSAIDELLKRNGNLTVDEIARYACKSTRQLERHCFEKLGMAPKLFSRLTRFGKVISMKEARPDLSWTAVCQYLGYYDQMHLIKEFKAFMGTSPVKSKLNSIESCKMMAALGGERLMHFL